MDNMIAVFNSLESLRKFLTFTPGKLGLGPVFNSKANASDC